MKDYKISEVKSICEKRKADGKDCIGCECSDLCYLLTDITSLQNIEPRDTIDIPSKQPRITIKDETVFDVYLRDVFGNVCCITYTDEEKADEFVKELKEERDSCA